MTADSAGDRIASLREAPDQASSAPDRLLLLAGLIDAARYAAFEGSPEDRDAALRYATEGLASAGADAGQADTCHLVIAWMALTRQLTSAQRAVVRTGPSVEQVRRDGAKAAEMLAALGRVEISPDDVETALSHLRQITAAGEMGDIVPMLWALALFAAAGAGLDTGDAGRVAADLWQAASQGSPETPEYAELQTLRAALLAVQAGKSGRPDQLKSAADALRDAAPRLPAGHPARAALLDLLRVSLSDQAATAGSAADVAAEVEWIVATLEGLPPDDPGYARTLTSVGIRLFTLGLSNRTAIPVDRLIAQQERALERIAPADQDRPLAEFIYWSAVGMRAAMEHRPDVADTAIAGLMRCGDGLPPEHPFRPYAAMAVSIALTDRYVMTGELRQIETAREYLREAFRLLEATGAAPNGYLLYLRAMLRMIPGQGEPVTGVPAEVIGDLDQAAGLIGGQDPLRPRVVAALQAARAVRGIMSAPAGPGIPLGESERTALEQVLAEAENISHDHPDFPGLAGGAAAGLMVRALADQDASLVDRAIALIAAACAVPGLTARERPRLLDLHGSALLGRYHLSRARRDLSNAVERLEEARRAVEQEVGSPYAADVLASLARAYRYRADARQAELGRDDPARFTANRADVDRAVTTGLAALREHAGDVLLQDSDENALSVARQGTSDATEMARWFLDRGRPAPAIDAIELGRGMVLHAATSGAELGEVLRDAGHEDLASEWARQLSGGEMAADLRYRIMTAIEGSTAEARLLSPPSAREIGAALTECRADALVYLLPRGEDGIGLGVLVDPGGGVRRVPLPGLYAGAGSPVEAALRARQRADAAGRDHAARKDWQQALGELCDWAWRAAIGPLLSVIPARGRGPERRVVLVPGGELGLVAWHAARRPDGGGHRYACQDAIFSYAPSARHFTEAARRRPRQWALDPVLISDSEPSLYATAVGIGYLHTEYYPAGSVFGYANSRLAQPPPGSAAATAADVLATLPHGTSPGASLLHFGCHGRAQVPALGSRLNLGDEGDLAVRDILRQARKWRAGVPGIAGIPASAESGGLVVLASCLSDVTEADFDEALTVATAFLSAGATGVVAARWSVADARTALFVTVFHHYLNGGQPDPARALRAAQLWMLDPGRVVPDGLPPVLGDEASDPGLTHPEAWAAFAYQGR
ncbi:MAG: CHAT domain-containing protein [Streptosporangiaceae bacterium]|jgi:tetratricopeptide (TPR) repeat protein